LLHLRHQRRLLGVRSSLGLLSKMLDRAVPVRLKSPTRAWALLVERFHPFPAGGPLCFHWENLPITSFSLSTAAPTSACFTAESFAAPSNSDRTWAQRASSPGGGGTALRISSNSSKSFSGTTHFAALRPSGFGPWITGALLQSLVFGELAQQ